MANHPNHNPDGRECLAQAFVHLIKHEKFSFFFMNNELLKKDFIKLVNCDDHTLDGISNIALVFEYIACHSLGRHNLRTSTPLRDAFIKFANQKNLTKAGRAYMAAAIIWIIDKKEDVNKMFSNEYGLSNTLIQLIKHSDNTDVTKKYIQDAKLEASNYYNEPACIVS